MRTRWFIVMTVVVLNLAACGQQTQGSGMEYSTTFERDIPVGKTLPGTDIKYLGKTDQGAQVSIGGQMALKRTLDSLDWRGSPVAGINAEYSLRVLTFDADAIKVGGTAKVVVTQPVPKASAASSLPKDALTFRGLIVTYDVKKGKTIPGTTLSYDDKTDDGAKLGGIEGYSYRKIADSIAWTGQLADKTFLQLDLRVVFYDDNSLKVTGTPTLLIAP